MARLKCNLPAVIALLLLLAVFVLATPAGAGPITIDNSSATAIRDNVTLANNGATIILSPGIYSESDITITGKSLTFRAADGHGPADTIIDAQSAGRIFNVTDTSSLTIDNLTLQNGHAPDGISGSDSSTGNGESGTAGADGGAIFSYGPVVLSSSVITGCSAGSGGNGGNGLDSSGPIYHGGSGGAGGSGGGVYTAGSVTLNASTITSCFAGRGGAGGYAIYGEGSSGAGGSGGAIRSDGMVILTSSTISGCRAGDGNVGKKVPVYPAGGSNGGDGGAVSATTVTLSASTISACSAGNGGAGTGSNGGNGGSGGSGGSGGAISGTAVDVTALSDIFGCSAGNGGNGGAGATAGTSQWAYLPGTGGPGGSGGAVAGFSANVTGSAIRDCSAGSGGSGGHGSYTVVSTSGGWGITSAGSGGSGGAVSAASAEVTDSSITGCSAGDGGAGEDGGTGGSAGNGGAVSATTITMNAASASGCFAGTGGNGGTGGYIHSSDTPGICIGDCPPGSSQSGNGGNGGSGGSGGALYVGGAATVLSSAFTGCSAATGGSGGSNGGGTGSAGSAGSTGNAGAVQTSGGSIHSSRLYNNTVGRIVVGSGSTVDATNNWWGTNTPDSSALVANAAMDSWLRLGVTASPSSIGTGGTSAVRANLLWNNTGYNTSADGLVPDGIPIIFTLVSGPGGIAPQQRTTAGGVNTTTYTSSGIGTAQVNATIDGESVGVLITVSSSAPTTTATPAPTATVTATFTQIPGSGTGGSGHQSHSSGSSGTHDLGYTGPQPTVMGYEPTQALPTGISAPGPQQQAQPTALEAATPGSGTSSGFPVTLLALFGAGGVVIAGSAWYIRRWWIRRQNPALFKEYD